MFAILSLGMGPALASELFRSFAACLLCLWSPVPVLTASSAIDSQCARRGLLCCYPSECRRGMRHDRPSRRVSYRNGSNIVFTPGSEDEYCTEGDDDDDEGDNEEDQQAQAGPSSRGGRQPKPKPKAKPRAKRRAKKRKAMEWILAIDAHFITPAAWEKYQRELASKKAEKEAAEAAAAKGLGYPHRGHAGTTSGDQDGHGGKDRPKESPPGSSMWPGSHDNRYLRQYRDRDPPPPRPAAGGSLSFDQADLSVLWR